MALHGVNVDGVIYKYDYRYLQNKPELEIPAIPQQGGGNDYFLHITYSGGDSATLDWQEIVTAENSSVEIPEPENNNTYLRYLNGAIEWGSIPQELPSQGNIGDILQKIGAGGSGSIEWVSPEAALENISNSQSGYEFSKIMMKNSSDDVRWVNSSDIKIDSFDHPQVSSSALSNSDQILLYMGVDGQQMNQPRTITIENFKNEISEIGNYSYVTIVDPPAQMLLKVEGCSADANIGWMSVDYYFLNYVSPVSSSDLAAINYVLISGKSDGSDILGWRDADNVLLPSTDGIDTNEKIVLTLSQNGLPEWTTFDALMADYNNSNNS